MKKSLKKNWPRHIIGWGVIIALVLFLTGIIPSSAKADPEAYCPFGGLEALGTYFVRGSLPCSMSSLQIIMGIALGVAVILFGRLFCGYLCPIGTVEDLLSRIRAKCRLPELRINKVADKILRCVKYVLLVLVFYFTISASELFCKYIDPYYAAATGFRGENVTVWICIITFTCIFFFGFFIKNFWCKYICPLGAISSILRCWGVFQVLKIHRDALACNHCNLCEKKCPMGIKLNKYKGNVNNVDCTLCGECLAACNTNALKLSVVRRPVRHLRFLPAILTVILAVTAAIVGNKYLEIPTINETWGIERTLEDGTKEVVVPSENLKSFTMSGLRSVKCFGSSRAFMGRLQRIDGVHGVKTYVKSHKAEITYDTRRITQESIERQIFVPASHKVTTPDPSVVDSIKIVTIYTENMSDKLDINYFSLQLRFSEYGSKIYGVDSEFSCPLTVHLYIDPSLELSEKWLKEIVNKKELVFPQVNPDKPAKTVSLGFKFVSVGEGVGYISTADFLHKMFNGFFVEWQTRIDKAAAEKAVIHTYEIEDTDFEKPVISRNMPFVSNTLSQHEGVAGVALALNDNLKPSIQVRFYAPMTGEKIWEILSAETWRIDYRNEKGVVEEPAKIHFKSPGTMK